MSKKRIILFLLLIMTVIWVQILLPGIIMHTDGFGNYALLNRVLASVLAVFGFNASYRFLKSENGNAIRNTLVSYINAAVAMGGVYYLIYVSHEGCYSFATVNETILSVLDFIYFSFVTVTTLGYGDIVPDHTLVRLLVVVQLLFGAYLLLRLTGNKCQQTECSR